MVCSSDHVCLPATGPLLFQVFLESGLLCAFALACFMASVGYHHNDNLYTFCIFLLDWVCFLNRVYVTWSYGARKYGGPSSRPTLTTVVEPHQIRSLTHSPTCVTDHCCLPLPLLLNPLTGQNVRTVRRKICAVWCRGHPWSDIAVLLFPALLCKVYPSLAEVPWLYLLVWDIYGFLWLNFWN